MKQIFILAISTVFLMSCKNETKTTEVSTTTEIEQVQNVNPDAIQLNNGEKWVVNEEMKPFVMKGESLVESYIKNNGTDYKKLAQEIKGQNDLLIKSCTMEGPSHDELHKWLHPHLEIVGQLEVMDNPEKVKVLITELQSSFQTYHQYFN